MSFIFASGGASLINMTVLDMLTRADRDTDCWRIASPQGSLPLDTPRDLARHPSPSPESPCQAELPALHHSEEGNVPVGTS